MELLLENIAKVKKAEIQIDGITGIIGYNSTGKSTVSKSLACVLQVFKNFSRECDRLRMRAVKEAIADWNEQAMLSLNRNIIKYADRNRYPEHVFNISRFFRFDYKNVYEIVMDPEFSSLDKEKFREMILGLLIVDRVGLRLIIKLDPNEMLEITVDKVIMEMLDTLKTDDLYYKFLDIYKTSNEGYEKILLKKAFEEYYSNQVSSFYNEEDGLVSLQDEDKNNNYIKFTHNNIVDYQNNFLSKVTPVYIQPCCILDSNLEARSNKLIQLFYKDNSGEETIESLSDKDKVLKVINKILAKEKSIGEISNDAFSVKYVEKDIAQEIEMCNVASGVKNIILIKKLAQAGRLNRNSFLILDEPEVNQHPKWQLLFAELLVHLHTEVGIKILINTHSPYFLRAIEYYSDKEVALDKCKFYYMKNEPGSRQCVAEDVTDKLDWVYDQMAEPLESLIDLAEENEDASELE